MTDNRNTAASEPVAIRYRFYFPDPGKAGYQRIGDWNEIGPGDELPEKARDVQTIYASPPKAPAARQPSDAFQLETYDAGLLNDYGGGKVEWWQDYLRAELARAHEFYQSQCEPVLAAVQGKK